MGRNSRLKRERRKRANAGKRGKQLVHITMPLPGAGHLAGPDGLFDDCEICRALRRGDDAEALRLTMELGAKQRAEFERGDGPN